MRQRRGAGRRQRPVAQGPDRVAVLGPAVALQADHGAPGRGEGRAPVDRLEGARERHVRVVDLDPRLGREASFRDLDREVDDADRAHGDRAGGPGRGRRARPAAPPRRRASPRRPGRRRAPRGRRRRPRAPRPCGRRAGARASSRVPRRIRAPAASAAAAIASISWPMPRAGKRKPSGAAWSSSRRRARSAGMRSSGSAVDLLQVAAASTRSTKAAPNARAQLAARPSRRARRAARAAGPLVEVAAGHDRGRRARRPPGGPPSAGRRPAGRAATRAGPRRGRTGCGRRGRRRTRRAAGHAEPAGAPRAPRPASTPAPARASSSAAPRPAGPAPRTRASTVMHRREPQRRGGPASTDGGTSVTRRRPLPWAMLGAGERPAAMTLRILALVLAVALAVPAVVGIACTALAGGDRDAGHRAPPPGGALGRRAHRAAGRPRSRSRPAA